MSIISAYLAKLLKDRGLFSGRNTDTGVADRDLSTIVYLVGCDADSPSLRSELHGIGKKIQKNLLDLALITDVFTKPLVHVNVQRNAVLRIGVLTPDPISARLYQFEAFKEGLRGLGYVEGQNIAFEIRSADGKRDRLAGLATELVSFKADVILTSTTTSKLGLFQKHGVNMELIAFPGGTVGLQALLAGDIQFATEDGLAGLQANLRGANLQFLAGMINSFPFLILSKPEIRVPGDLRGKKIAISRYGSSSDTAVRAVLERYKLRPDKDVIILQGGGQTERFAALRAGAVDAAIVSPPLNLAGRALGFNEVIDLSESGIPYAHQEIVAQKDFIDRNPDLVMRTLRGLIEGQAQWKDQAKKGVIIGLVAKYLRLDPEKNRDQIEETYRYYSKIFSSKPYATLEGMEFTAQILKKNLPEAKDLQAKDYVNNRFVGQLEKEGFLARVYGGR